MQYEIPISFGLEIMAKFKVFQNFMVKVTRSKLMVLSERSCHKEYAYEI